MVQSARDILASQLKKYRIKKGLTVYDVGEKIGKSGKTVSAWENGHGQPDAETFVQLYYLYGMESMSLFFGIEDADVPDREKQLLSAFRRLNDTGQVLALATVKAYDKCGEYKLVVDDDS